MTGYGDKTVSCSSEGVSFRLLSLELCIEEWSCSKVNKSSVDDRSSSLVDNLYIEGGEEFKDDRLSVMGGELVRLVSDVLFRLLRLLCALRTNAFASLLTLELLLFSVESVLSNFSVEEEKDVETGGKEVDSDDDLLESCTDDDEFDDVACCSSLSSRFNRSSHLSRTLSSSFIPGIIRSAGVQLCSPVCFLICFSIRDIQVRVSSRVSAYSTWLMWCLQADCIRNARGARLVS